MPLLLLDLGYTHTLENKTGDLHMQAILAACCAMASAAHVAVRERSRSAAKRRCRSGCCCGSPAQHGGAGCSRVRSSWKRRLCRRHLAAGVVRRPWPRASNLASRRSCGQCAASVPERIDGRQARLDKRAATTSVAADRRRRRRRFMTRHAPLSRKRTPHRNRAFPPRRVSDAGRQGLHGRSGAAGMLSTPC